MVTNLQHLMHFKYTKLQILTSKVNKFIQYAKPTQPRYMLFNAPKRDYTNIIESRISNWMLKSLLETSSCTYTYAWRNKPYVKQ